VNTNILIGTVSIFRKENKTKGSTTIAKESISLIAGSLKIKRDYSAPRDCKNR
jgi:hypothetical protein